MLNESRFRIFDTMGRDQGLLLPRHRPPGERGLLLQRQRISEGSRKHAGNDFDYVVIDGEAGIEQIQRRVMEKVTHLILISDPEPEGDQGRGDDKGSRGRAGDVRPHRAIINRVTNPELNQYIQIPGVEILAFIAADDTHAANDIQGKSVFELPQDSQVLYGVREALRKIEIL